jgi:hypothetical protein
MAYSKEEIEKLFDSICEDIENGLSLRAVLRKPETPSSQTFFKWIDKDEEKAKQYARATKLRADAVFDEILDIADNVGNDIITTPSGEEVVNNAVIARDRLRVDARKWAVAKMNPKKYGDKLELDGQVSISPFLEVMKQAGSDDAED